MNGQWYYSHGGITHGPFSMEEIKEHAARKKLVENDLIWQGGSEPRDAIVAQAAIDFSNLTLAASPAPDWLQDVAQVERTGPLPGPTASKDTPDWLEDMRVYIALDLYASARTSQETSVLQPGGIPDWLDSWIVPEPPTTNQPALPPAPAIKEHGEKTEPTLKPEDVLAAKAIEETGFDIKTGQILDADKFHRWQKASHSKQTAITNESLFETFRRARVAIEEWVDAEDRVPLILVGDLNAIKRNASLTALLQQYQNFGLTMQQKLLHHLEFMVENRRKYYAARSK